MDACIKYQLPKLNASGKPEIVRELLATSGKQLHETVIDAIVKVPASDNPLYLAMMVQRLTILDRDDFKKIERAGDGIHGINRELMRIIRKTPQTVEGICATFINEISERANPSICEDVIAFIACSRRGLRESDLISLYTKDASKWISADFALLRLYLEPFLIYREDGRIDFLHKSIRLGILQQISSDYYYEDILNHLKQLPEDDTLRESELVWHIYKGDDMQYLTDYVRWANGFSKERQNFVAKELAEITLEPEDGRFWMEDFFDAAFENGASTAFCDYINRDYESAFLQSVEGINKLLPMMIKNKEIALKIAEREDSVDARGSLAISYLMIGRLCKSIGDIEQALEMFELYTQMLERMIGEDDNLDTMIGLEMGYRHVAGLYETIGQYDKALETYKKDREISLSISEQSDEEENGGFLRDCYLQMSRLYQNMGKIREALDCCEQANGIAEELYSKTGSIHLLQDLGYTYNRLGDIYNEIGKYEDALSMYEKGKDIAHRCETAFGTTSTLQDISYSCSRLSAFIQSADRASLHA